MVGRVTPPSSLFQARRDKTTQQLEQLSKAQDIQQRQAEAPLRNKLLDLQAQQYQQELELAPRREQRLQSQESRQQAAFQSDEKKRKLANFIEAAPIINAEARRIKQLPLEQRSEEIAKVAPALSQIGMDVSGFDPNDNSDASLDRVISQTESVIKRVNKGKTFAVKKGINPKTGKVEWFRDNSNGIEFTGVEPPPSDASIKLEQAKVEKQEKQAKAAADAQRQASLMVFDISRAINQSEGVFTTGFTGSVVSAIPGTPAYDLKQTLEPIKANISFNELNKMRQNSPTGGALGNVTVRELELLQSVYGSIEQSQSKDQFQRNMKRLETIFQAVVNGTTAIPFTQEDFDKIPPGETYISPDTGTLHRKQ